MNTELACLCSVAYEERLNARAVDRRARVRAGQIVYVRSSETRAPYIARVKSVRNGTVRMQWFYRPCDIPPSAMLGAPEPAQNELFASDLFDDNPIETILAPCAVSTAPTGPNVYFSRRAFTGSRVVFGAAVSECESNGKQTFPPPPKKKKSGRPRSFG